MIEPIRPAQAREEPLVQRPWWDEEGAVPGSEQERPALKVVELPGLPANGDEQPADVVR